MFDVFKKCFGCSKQTLGAAFDNKLFWASLKISNYELIGHQTPKKATGPRNFCYMCTLFLSLNFKCKLKGVTISGHSKGSECLPVIPTSFSDFVFYVEVNFIEAYSKTFIAPLGLLVLEYSMWDF